jgi:hypothetical protein
VRTRANETRRAHRLAEINLDEAMKRRTFSRGYLVGIASLAAVNVALFILLLKPGEIPRESISEASIVPETLDTTSSAEKNQIDPRWFGEFWTDLRGPFAKFANASKSNLQEDGSTAGVIDEAAATTEMTSSNSSSRIDYSAIGAVIRANSGNIPATGEELAKALLKLGDFSQLPIPFSAVALDSGLSHPRVVITQRPEYMQRSLQDPTKSQLTVSKTDRDLLGNSPANQPNLVGRLFLAANMEMSSGPRNPHVQTVEFISWNSRYMKFDFGIIEGMGESPVIKFVDGVRCMSCHKNKGPILGNNPWSNTTHNDLVRSSSSNRFIFEPKDPSAPPKKDKGKDKAELRDDIDGMTVLTPHAAEVDAGVRAGADLLHNRRIFRALAQSPQGRDVFVLLLNAIVESGPLDTIDSKIRPRINSVDLTRFMFDAATINNAVVPSRLVDFSPAGSIGIVTTSGTSWGGTIDLVAVYDAKRADGKHGLSGSHLPSNPKAFFKLPFSYPNRPSDLVSAVMLARTIGLTEGDRIFFRETLIAAARSASRLRVEPSTIARQIFAGSQFTDVLTSGDLPDRDDFKDRFVAGLSEALEVNDISAAFLPERERYALVPKRDASRKGIDIETELIPTTSCLRCHDIRTPGKNAQTAPIPLLAFDPFDKTSRENWLKTADQQRKQVVLSRMLKRIGVDQDMPPEDSLEHKMFRTKNPASFEEVKQFLEAELKKVRRD